MKKQKIIFIVGPTGVGKTALAFELAKLFSSEFVSCDSMQIYRGMDIVTDKLPKPILKKYSYHLLNIIEPSKEYNVADFCCAAKKAIAGILKKKKLPVVVGGTGLYVNSLLYGIFEGPGKDEKIRLELEAEAGEKGAAFLYERLKKVDPDAASKISLKNLRRIVRALEVYEIAKKPLSALQKEKDGLADIYDVHIFGLRRERADLYERINQRVDFMINSGLLSEVRSLLEKKLSKTAYYCIGIREMEGFLKGQYNLEEAVRLIKRNSRHYAKRQMTWFNKNKDIEWIDVKAGDDMRNVAEKICSKV